MLVLNRMIGEKIIIGDNVQVKILEIDGAYVMIGIATPHEIEVHFKDNPIGFQSKLLIGIDNDGGNR